MTDRGATAVAIVGAGSAVARRHWESFNALDGVNVVAGIDIDPAARERIADEWLVPVFPSVQALAASRHIDLAVDCVPDWARAAVIGDTLAAGWHTLAEKPMAYSPRAAAALYRKAARRWLYLKSALQRRHMTERLLELLRDGTLTSVREIDAQWWSSDPMPAWRRQLRGRGGVIADRIVHLLSQADAFLTETVPIRVTTRAVLLAGARVENSARIIVDYANGATLTACAGFDRAVPADEVSLRLAAPNVQVTALLPTLQGPDEAEQSPPMLCTLTDAGPVTRPLPRLLTVAECHAQLARDTISAVRRGAPAGHAEVARELRLLSLVDAAYASLEKDGAPIAVRNSDPVGWEWLRQRLHRQRVQSQCALK